MRRVRSRPGEPDRPMPTAPHRPRPIAATTSLIAPDLDASDVLGPGHDRRSRSTEPTTTIVLHAKELDVDARRADLRAATRCPASSGSHAERDQLVIEPSHRSASGRGDDCELRFAAPISHGLLGFYRSTYVDDAGASGCSAATQFEAPHARAAFPCFDEPEFKAMFAITLVVADGPARDLERSRDRPRASSPTGTCASASRETIPMSTYLVAWVVGPLELTEPVDAGGVAVRVAHVPGQGAPHAVRARRRRRSRSRSSPTTTASRIPARSATSSRSPTSRSARWRTSAA